MAHDRDRDRAGGGRHCGGRLGLAQPGRQRPCARRGGGGAHRPGAARCPGVAAATRAGCEHPRPAPAAHNAVSQAAPVAPTVPAASPAVKPKPRPEPPPSTTPRSASTEVAPVKPSPAASAASPALPVAPLLSELPEEIRRQIPALTITGAVASENPAQRLLLVNGQVLPQGAAAAPEVLIEEIRARSSTFKFRGSRFRVTY